MSQSVTFKVTWMPQDGTSAITRRISHVLPCQLADFVSVASDRFNLPITVVKWTDEDGDEITMTTEAEWQDMQDALGPNSTTLRVTVVAGPQSIVNDEASNTATPTTRALDAADTQEPTLQAEGLPAEGQDAPTGSHVLHDRMLPSAENVQVKEEKGSAAIAPAVPDMEDPPLEELPQTFSTPSSPHREQRVPREGGRSAPGDLFELLNALPAHLQSMWTEVTETFQNPADVPAQLPSLARNLHEEFTRVFTEVAATVRNEAERARADYDRFKDDLQREKEKLTSELESKIAEMQAGLNPRHKAETSGEAGEDETAKEERRQAARLARQRERDAKQREAVRQGEKAETSDSDGSATNSDKQSRQGNNSTTRETPPLNAATGPSASWYLPGSFSREPYPSLASSYEATPHQVRQALAELGFQDNLGVRIAAERAWETNRGKSPKQMVEAAVEMLI
ncbi:hypothetical protein OIV83_000104 [Microbotryomycetes sp. JL201]|nr:hypothetical protein OIV83_000104 [Microbotryomycetes sp. JL201]